MIDSCFRFRRVKLIHLLPLSVVLAGILQADRPLFLLEP